jgi:hypothetical protein
MIMNDERFNGEKRWEGGEGQEQRNSKGKERSVGFPKVRANRKLRTQPTYETSKVSHRECEG